ncbi:MAG: thioesterase family protein [Paracoccus sp. (in: a-proteobacteria)]|nr:thioesterase family protein [Paracoccus sp. (in: a-proteobacteria)]
MTQFRVLPEWVDYNGHMGDFAYGIVFSRAVTALMDQIGLDADYRAQTDATLYTLEMRIGFRREMHEGDRLSVSTRVLAHDARRMHLYQEMLAPDGVVAAWCEQVLIHVTREGGAPRGSAFPQGTADALSRLHAAAQDEKLPEWLDRRTGLG